MDSVRAYRTSTMEGASHIDVILACYDALSESILLAAGAAARSDLEARCRYSEHAFILLGHLQSWIDLLDDFALRDGLVRFYCYVREEMLCLQAKTEEKAYRNLAMKVCETRAAWQERQARLSTMAIEGDGDFSGERGELRFSCSV